ncbi:hypothetical protein PFICI_05454 [Pestalotiopsis fici W106-1]|uniref:Uncharacterized protein n=1 Tax=Pestalotiopsis fici (strain W106-1 / CGMCC3.15140) TaxID=1229662 RepID=W3XBW6_PESFW|nr:uncharacterized protein PFICI_05454 [Pestalotiopsis fici W106-1]ETS83578.1 hypothetical protein PFICI_05454 [Pestalotiopsis fici W106-1]
MAIWPFRRKGSRKRSPGRGRAQDAFDAPQRAMTEPATNTDLDHASGSDRAKQKRQRESPSSKKLSRKPRTYSFSPGRRDSIRFAKARQESVPPLPTGPIPASIQQNHYGAAGQGSSGAAANEAGIRDQTPTLHLSISQQKRSAQPLPRKNSSKRRKQDHDREAEIRALSQSHTMPARLNADNWTQGKPVKRNSKRHKSSSLMRKWHRPDSDISLPIAESLHSAMSEDSEHISYRVSAFDALAPRPTIRYASNPVFGAPSQPGPLRSQSVKRKLSERARISEAELKAHKRVDNLADDLDASDLRELMERDKRRRERKQEKERERVERRLARRAERQRAEEAEARKNGTPPPQNLERGVLGREAPAVETDTTSAVVTSTRRRPSAEDAEVNDSSPKSETEDGKGQRAPSPLEEFHRENSFDAGADEIQRDPLPEQKQTSTEPAKQESRSPSPGIIGFMRSRKRRSKSPLPTGSEQHDGRSESTRIVSKSESESLDRRLSESSSSRPWLSRFRWSRRGGKARRTSDEPSSFSNTSRDSMPTAQQGSQTPTYAPVQRSNSKVPKRTMSRFREDLPELPLSPPDSRVASPEGEVQQPEPLAAITDDVVMRYDTPASGHRETPNSLVRDEVQPSPAPHSMSMASIDSEGSWFGGRVNRKRTSSGVRGSMNNYPLRSVSGDSVDQDEDATHDRDFLNIVTDEKHLNRKSTGEALPSSDEEDEIESPKWGNVTRTPTFTHHRETMRSREGLLLHSFEDDEKEYESEKGSEEVSSFGAESPVNLQSATSVKVAKGHGRNYSAGSAKLLDISPRVSSDIRRSLEPVTQ